MNPFLRLRNRYTLYRLHKNIDLIENPRFIDHFTFIMSKDYKKKGSLDRNLAASVIKQYRRKFPYELKDYSTAKKMYEDYFKMEGHLQFDSINERFRNGETIYLCHFRREAPVKGEKYAEYHINLSGSNEKSIFVMDSELDREFYTNTRLATDREIEKFKELQETISNLNVLVKQKMEELRIAQSWIHEAESQFVNNL